MLIFNLNALAVFSGPFLGRSAGLPSCFNLFWECFKIYKWKVLSKKYKINLTQCRKPVNKSMRRHPNLTSINFPCAGLINHCTGPLIWPALISRVPVNKSMHRPPNLTGINFPCASINCRRIGYQSINQRSVPQLNKNAIHFGDRHIGFLFRK